MRESEHLPGDARAASAYADHVAELVGAWLELARRGAAPEPEVWFAQHPDEADDLRAALHVMRAMRSSVLPSTDGEPERSVGAEPEVADAAGRYRIQEELARGGFGIVLRGHDGLLRRDVAVKVLRPDRATRAEQLGRFVEEAQIGGQLEHPGIVPVYDMGVCADGRPFLTMKLVGGETVATLLARAGARSEERWALLPAFASVCHTVAYAHARGVLHRDLKPDNVMVGDFGEVLVLDWGLGKVLGGRDTPEGAAPHGGARMSAAVVTTRGEGGADASVAGSTIGTPAYMSPEQARGAVVEIDARSDVFALGAILAEILCGAPPYVGTKSEILAQASLGDLTRLNARLAACGADPALVQLALRCLSVKPGDRPSNASVVAGELAKVQASADARRRDAEQQAAAARVRAEEEQRRRRLTLRMSVALVVATLLGASGWILLEAGRRRRTEAAEREVALALEDAVGARARARAGPDGLLAWSEAEAAALRAVGLARLDGVGAALRERGEALLAQVASERRAAVEAARQADLQQRMVARLDEIRQAAGEHYDGGRAVREYRDAFLSLGIDLRSGLDPHDLVARLRALPIADAVIVALDDWRRVARDVEEPVEGLDALLDVADPHPWRRRLRSATTGEELRALAQAENLETLPAEDLVALARDLGLADEAELGAAVALRAQQRSPGDFWANKVAGDLMSDVKPPRHADAVRFYTAALALRPQSFAVLNNMATALIRTGALEEAGQAVEQALALAPWDWRAYSNLGEVRLRQKRYDDAVAAQRRAVELDDGSPAAHTNLARALGTRGDLAEALVHARRAASLAPRVAEQRCLSAHLLLLLGKQESAITELEEAVRLDERSASAHRQLGDALRIQGSLAPARKAFETALALDDSLASAHLGLGLVLLAQGEREAAVLSFEAAVERDPRLAEAQLQLGVAYMGRGDAHGAARALERAVENGGGALCHYNLGCALAALRRPQDAIRAYRAALELKPGFAAAHDNLGVALQRLGDYQAALTEHERALALDASLVQAKENLGVARFHLGDAVGAIRELREALRMDAGHKTARENLAAVLESIGEKAEAERVRQEGRDRSR